MRCTGRAWVTVFTAWAALVTPAASQNTAIELSGGIRIRSESDRRLATGLREGHTLLRTRLNLRAPVAPYATVFMQIQDARVFGEETSTLSDASADQLDVHQAYVQLETHLGPLPVALRAGRQEILLGNERLVGVVGWSNTGRSFDAFRLLVEPDENQWKLTGLVATVVEEGRATTAEGAPPRMGDHTLLALALEAGAIRAFALHDLNARHRSWIDIDRTTLGAEVRRSTSAGLHYGVEGAYQFGDHRLGDGEATDQQDISAWMLWVRLGWTGSVSPVELVEIGADWLSGDEDPTASHYSAFNTLYATNHKFYGFMDLFLDPAAQTNDGGLVDAMATLGVNLREPFLARATLHRFSLASGGESVSEELGWEIDLTVPFELPQAGTVQFGYSLFVTGDGGSAVGLGESGKTRQWAYLQLGIGF